MSNHRPPEVPPDQIPDPQPSGEPPATATSELPKEESSEWFRRINYYQEALADIFYTRAEEILNGDPNRRGRATTLHSRDIEQAVRDVLSDPELLKKFERSLQEQPERRRIRHETVRRIEEQLKQKERIAAAEKPEKATELGVFIPMYKALALVYSLQGESEGKKKEP